MWSTINLLASFNIVWKTFNNRGIYYVNTMVLGEWLLGEVMRVQGKEKRRGIEKRRKLHQEWEKMTKKSFLIVYK